MSQNRSEILFEEFCSSAGIKYFSVPTEAHSKTPDYELIVGEQKVVVEVKEIERNREEIESDRLLQQRGYGNATGGVPGQKVRLKIQSCSGQIKARSQRIHPSFLVLYEHHIAAVNIEPYEILVAMYGLETFILAVPEKGRPYLIDKKLGPRRKMTEHDNTSISGVATLRKRQTGRTELTLYHNKYAAIHLNAHILAQYDVVQFRLAQTEVGSIPCWEHIA